MRSRNAVPWKLQYCLFRYSKRANRRANTGRLKAARSPRHYRFDPPHLSMRMPVMQVGIMRVLVPQRRVAVPMAVRLARRIARRMRVAVVLVVAVPMLVLLAAA